MQRILIILFFIISPFLIINSAYGVDTTFIENELDEFDNLIPTSPFHIIYPIIFLVSLTFFMTLSFRYMDQQWGSIFSIASLVICVVLSLLFISPTEFGYETISYKSDIEIITSDYEVLDSLNNAVVLNSTTTHSNFIQDETIVIMIPNEIQFKTILTSFFSVLALFNGLFAILIITNVLPRKK